MANNVMTVRRLKVLLAECPDDAKIQVDTPDDRFIMPDSEDLDNWHDSIITFHLTEQDIC
jgi:hypothetical protein